MVRFRRLRWVPALLALILTVLFVLLLLAVLRPAGYRPASLDYRRLREDKSDLVRLVDGIGAALAARQPVDITLPESQLNRWIVARGELWPEAGLLDIGPIRSPALAVAPDNRVRLFATLDRGGWPLVLSAEVTWEARQEEFVVRLSDACVGCLSVPVNWIGPLIRNQLHERGGLRLEGGALVVSRDWIWPNGRRPLRIAQAETGPGGIRILIAPR